MYFINVRLSCRRTGQAYLELRPTYSIWLLAENLLVDDNAYVHHYKMRDEQGQTLTLHGGIWLLELKKFNATQVETEDQRWLKFFKDGERLNDEALPDWMITQEMKQAMSTLSTFSEKDQQYYQYQARQEYLREQRTIQSELEQANKREEEAKRREEAANKREALALQEKKASENREALALAEIERLKALLAHKE
jgi:hypothetical protein